MISDSLAYFCEDIGIGIVGVDIFVRQQPESPDNCITIYDETGVVLAQNQAFDMDTFGSQFLFRGSYEWVSGKALEVHRNIAGLSGKEVPFPGDIELISTQIQSVPAFIGNDDRGRVQYSAHYLHDCKIGHNAHRTEK